MYRHVALTALVPALLLVASCGNDSTNPNGTPAASRLGLVQPPSTEAYFGEPLPQQPIVALQTSTGLPVGLAGVTITAEASQGELSGSTTALTDANGRATFTDLALLGDSVFQSLRFTAPGLAGVSATVRVKFRQDRLRAVTPRSVSLPAGSTPAESLTVQLTNWDGWPIGNVPVIFSSSNRIISGRTVLTDMMGRASLPLTRFPLLPFFDNVTATVAASTLSVTFDVEGTATGTVEVIPVTEFAYRAIGETYPLPTVRVTHGGPIAGALVYFRYMQGDPDSNVDSAYTDANGEVSGKSVVLRGPGGGHTIEIIAPGHSATAGYAVTGVLRPPVRLTGSLFKDPAVDPRTQVFVDATDADGTYLCGYAVTATEIVGTGAVSPSTDTVYCDWWRGAWFFWQWSATAVPSELRLTGPFVDTPVILKENSPSSWGE